MWFSQKGTWKRGKCKSLAKVSVLERHASQWRSKGVKWGHAPFGEGLRGA